MEQKNSELSEQKQTVSFDFGTFEGFNFRSQTAIFQTLTAEMVINWDHDRDGEAEFWPSGDNPGIQSIFKGRSDVTAFELLKLDELFQELGGDCLESCLRIYYALHVLGLNLENLTCSDFEDLNICLFIGESFLDLRKEAAYELFESYYPEEYKVWEKSHCDGLIFDSDRFLDSPGFSVDELVVGNQKCLIVAID